jgi:hypothetical protein
MYGHCANGQEKEYAAESLHRWLHYYWAKIAGEAIQPSVFKAIGNF